MWKRQYPPRRDSMLTQSLRSHGSDYSSMRTHLSPTVRYWGNPPKLDREQRAANLIRYSEQVKKGLPLK